MMKKILVLDNYDSFTYNLVHYLEQLTDMPVEVFRNDEISLEAVNQFDKILLSPGPGLPKESNILMPLIEKYALSKSILGVCLGLQAITEVFGGELLNLNEVLHGIATPVNVLDLGEPLFYGLPQRFQAGRYHSWVADKDKLPTCLETTCEDDNKQVMAIRHKKYDVKGVQFHPESVLTEHGLQIIENWLKS